jgi:hypothetical protein
MSQPDRLSTVKLTLQSYARARQALSRRDDESHRRSRGQNKVLVSGERICETR